MIKCFIVMCAVANPALCLPPEEITPIDHAVTSPMECLRGGGVTMSTRDPNWFIKTYGRMDGDGADIVPNWLAREHRRLELEQPQTACSNYPCKPNN